VALFLYAALLKPDTPVVVLLLPAVVLGFANAFTWSPVSSTATRGLPPREAGAGSGVYNTTRQIGGVIGSAAIAALIQARLAADLPARPGGASTGAASFGTALPSFLHDGFSAAMAESLVLPASVILVGALAALFFVRPRMASWKPADARPAEAAGRPAPGAAEPVAGG
jgi:sugar phosphate permease